MPSTAGLISPFRKRLWLLVLPAALAAGVAVGAGAPAALADTTVQVSGPGGSGCTLQDAVAFANTPSAGMTTCNQPAVTGSAGTITIDVPAGDYKLSSTLELSSSADVVIDGSGSGTTGTLFDGNDAVEPIDVTSGQVTIVGVRVENGNSGTTTETGGSGPDEPIDGNPGGGIDNAGSLTLNGDVIDDNTAGSGSVTLGCSLEAAAQPALVDGPALTPPPPTPRPPFGPIRCPDSVSGGFGGSGGGIYNTGSLTIADSVITQNRAGGGGLGDSGTAGSSTTPAGGPGGEGGEGGFGGGIYSEGSLQITGSAVTGNTAGAAGDGGGGGIGASGGAGGAGGIPGFAGVGGGISAEGPSVISSSTVSGNTSGTGGTGGAGGAAGTGATAGTAAGDGDGGDAGGVEIGDASATVQDSTIADNATGGPDGSAGAGGDGAGIFVNTILAQPLLQDTIARNSTAAGGAGGGIIAECLPARLVPRPLGCGSRSGSVENSIIASNSPDNCADSITGATTPSGSATNVVYGDTSCSGSGFTVANPMLGPAADNGGPTETMALAPGSAALGFDPASSCPLGVDQRGVARPQPGESGCDAGAYEHAVPVISAVGATATLSSATVSAQINPELSSANTTVVVQYGTTAAYGSTFGGGSIARGAVAVPFSATLSGLAPSTTYHYRLVATNGDPIAGPDGTPGQAVTADATFKTPAVPPPPPATPKLAVAVRSVSVSGAKARLKLVCTGGGPGARCSGAVTLVAATTAKKGKAAKGKAPVKRKPRKQSKPVKGRAVTVAGGRYAMASGKSQTVAVSLNKVGRKLLLATYKLPVAVHLGGAAARYKLKFAYPKVKAIVLYTAKWNGRGLDTISGITVRAIPKGAAVRFACQTGPCSPRAKAFTVKKGASRLSLGNTVVRLRPKATVAFEVTHPGQVGHVLELRDDGPGAPKQSILCLPPSAKKPTKCA